MKEKRILAEREQVRTTAKEEGVTDERKAHIAGA